MIIKGRKINKNHFVIDDVLDYIGELYCNLPKTKKRKKGKKK